MGASVAHHLARRCVDDILVIDRSRGPGMGSTGAATGGFRAQFATEINVKLSLLARERLLNFQEETGVNPEYNPAGYLFLASSEDQLGFLRGALETQRQAGLNESREVSPEEAAKLNPNVSLGEAIGGTFCTIDGFMRPLKILEGCQRAAISKGVRFCFDTELEALSVSEGRVVRAETSSGSIEVDTVVNAAGVWAAEVAEMVGFALPVVPIPRHVATTVPTGILPQDMPMTVFASDGFHFRVRDGRILLIWTTQATPEPSFDTTVDPSWLDRVYQRGLEAIPALKDAPLDLQASWAGLYEVSPDKTAILGRPPEFENFYLINGSSGHGVMHSLALGQLAAEMIVDGEARSLDTHALRPTRFAEGEPNPSYDIL